MQFNRSRFSIGCLLATVALIAVVIAGITFTPIILERARWQVHPSEQEIADYIRYNLSGTYRADPKVSFHIIDVYLEGTLATDKDVDVLLQLKYLEYLNLANTEITAKSLDKIIGHKSIQDLRVTGSGISQKALRAARKKASWHIEG